MDGEVERLHALLLAAKLPSTINDLRNPTQTFVVNLFVSFLRCFKIDVNAISKPTFEQQSAMSCLEDTDIVGIINLYMVMRQICDQIFMPEFFISDITNPVSKRICKLARYLANFIFYMSNKESDMEANITKIRSKCKLLAELQERRKEKLALANKKATFTFEQSSLKEKIEMEIDKMQTLIANNESKKLEQEEKIIVAVEKRQKQAESCNELQLEAARIDKEVADVKSEVVNSPEEHRSRLCDLEEQTKTKVEQRNNLQETFLAKVQLLKTYEDILSFIQKKYEEFPEVKSICERLKQIREGIQGETLENSIIELIKIREINTTQLGATNNEIHVQTEKLNSLHELRAQISSNKKLAMVKLEEGTVSSNNLRMEKDKIQNLIKKVEEDISTFIKDCQELYKSEVAIEINLREQIGNLPG